MTLGFSEFMQSFRNGFFDGFFNGVSFLGEEYIYIVVLCILYFAVNKKMCEHMGLVLFFSLVFNTVLKGIFMAERPYQKYPDIIQELRHAEGSSFPSGHTQSFSAFVFAGAFWLRKKAVLIGAGVMSVMMALSRIYLGVHWLEDVVAALILGYVSAYVLYRIFMKYRDDDALRMKLYVGILIVFLPFPIIFSGNSDIFKAYGLMAGFTLAMFLEKRYVNFTMDVAVWQKILRVVLGIVMMVFLLVLLDTIGDKIAEEGELLMNIFGFFKYGLMVSLGLGGVPFIMKKLHL